MPPVEASQSLPVTVERIALLMRYVLFAVISPVFLLGHFGRGTSAFLTISAMVLAHNIIVHVLLWTRSYWFFYSPLNFAIYLIQIVIIIAITGADSSDGYILYFLLIIGFTAYDRRLRKTMQVTVCCVVTYAAVIIYENFSDRLTVSLGVIIIRMLSIAFVGWMIGVLSERLRRAEILAAEQTAQVMSAENTLRAILNSAGDPIIVFDDNEYVAECNERATEFLSVSRADIIGKRFRSFLFDDGTLPQKLADLRARGQTEFAQIVVTSDGEERDVRLFARSYVRDGSRYFVVLLRDETMRMNYEESARVAAMKHARLNTELRELDNQHADFIQTISVQLRAPLTAVGGYVEMLLNEELGDLNPDQRKALQTCRRGIMRAFRAIEQSVQEHATRRPKHHRPENTDTASTQDEPAE